MYNDIYANKIEGTKNVIYYPVAFATRCAGVFTSIDFGTYEYNTLYNDWQLTTENTSKSKFTISTSSDYYVLANTKISWFSIGV